jgi:hypothetical protein
MKMYIVVIDEHYPQEVDAEKIKKILDTEIQGATVEVKEI